MLKLLAAFWCRKSGWKYTGHVPKRLSKSILVAGPNRGFKSLLIGIGLSGMLHYKSRFMVHQKWFVFPLNFILRRSGARKYDPENLEDISMLLVNRFNERRKYSVVVSPPSGSFQSSEWHNLFYNLSLKTSVPIVLVAVDYEQKSVKFHSHFKPGLDKKRDLDFIKNWFRNNHVVAEIDEIEKLQDATS